MSADRRVVVARVRKPHGLKGEVSLFPLTGEPGRHFALGRELWVVGMDGAVLAGPVTVEKARGYHREWLVKFAGLDRREDIEGWRDVFLAVPEHETTPPDDGEVYLHELEGFAVRHVDGTALGLVSSMYELPSGLMLEVQGPKREWMLPFRKEFVRTVDRAGRLLVVEPPDGLVDA